MAIVIRMESHHAKTPLFVMVIVVEWDVVEWDVVEYDEREH